MKRLVGGDPAFLGNNAQVIGEVWEMHLYAKPKDSVVRDNNLNWKIESLYGAPFLFLRNAVFSRV